MLSMLLLYCQLVYRSAQTGNGYGTSPVVVVVAVVITACSILLLRKSVHPMPEVGMPGMGQRRSLLLLLYEQVVQLDRSANTGSGDATTPIAVFVVVVVLTAFSPLPFSLHRQWWWDNADPRNQCRQSPRFQFRNSWQIGDDSWKVVPDHTGLAMAFFSGEQKDLHSEFVFFSQTTAKRSKWSWRSEETLNSRNGEIFRKKELIKRKESELKFRTDKDYDLSATFKNFALTTTLFSDDAPLMH